MYGLPANKSTLQAGLFYFDFFLRPWLEIKETK